MKNGLFHRLKTAPKTTRKYANSYKSIVKWCRNGVVKKRAYSKKPEILGKFKEMEREMKLGIVAFRRFQLLTEISMKLHKT